MKKIMNEWKKWLWETAPTDKDLISPVKPATASPHHRALPQFYRGKFENGLKVGLKKYFSNGNLVTLSKFFQKIKNDTPELRPEVAKTLIGLHYLYKNKDKYGGLYNVNPGNIHAPGEVGGFIFDAQPMIKGKKPEKTMEKIVKMMGDVQIVKDYLKSGLLPSTVNIDHILNNIISPPPPSQKKAHLAQRAANIGDFYANLPKRNK